MALETTLCHSEVDRGHQVSQVGWNLHKLVTCRHEQAEGWVVVNRLLADLHHLSWSLLHQVLSQDWHKHRLNAINLLDNESLSESDGKLNVGVELRVLVVEDLDIL